MPIISKINSKIFIKLKLYFCASYKINPGRLAAITEIQNFYYNHFISSIIAADVDEYGPAYINLISGHLESINQAVKEKDVSYLPVLREIACTKFEIRNNAEYFAFNHVRTLSMLATNIIILSNFYSINVDTEIKKNIIPIYLVCKDEEAVCIGDSLARTLFVFMNIFPEKIISFLDSRKNRMDTTYTEQKIINYAFKKYWKSIQKGEVSLKDEALLKIVKFYAESKGL